MNMKPRSEALGAIHETMGALHQIGAVDRETMNDIESACLIEAMPSLLSEQQAADYLNVSVAFVRQQLQTGELVCADQPGGSFLIRNDVVAYKQRVAVQRRVRPAGPARALLKIVEANPEALSALHP